jgi:hypothetical protein
MEDRTQHCLVVVVGSWGSQDMIGCKMEGKLPKAVAVHGHSDEEVGEGDLPCEVAVACRKHQVHIQDEVGSSSGDRRLGVRDAGSRDHNEGEVAVCASGWEVPRRPDEVGSRSQACRTFEAGGQRECSQESPWVHE